MAKLSSKEIDAIIAKVQAKAKPELEKLDEADLKKYKLPKELEDFIPKIFKAAKLQAQQNEINEELQKLSNEYREIKRNLDYKHINFGYMVNYLSDVFKQITNTKPTTITKEDKETLRKLFYYASTGKSHTFNSRKLEQELILAGITKDFDLEKLVNNFKNYIE